MTKEIRALRTLSEVRDAVSKGLADIATEDLLVSHLQLGDNAEGYRWELHRGEVPFWVDLMRFDGKLDLLVAYSIMFMVPQKWDETQKGRLFRYLLECNDFSQTWDAKFFLKDDAVILCSSRMGDEIDKHSARILVDTFSRFAQMFSIKVYEEFEDLTKLTVKRDDSEIPGVG